MSLPPTASFDGFDWFLVLILVLSTVAAFFRGFIKALFSLGGLILGIIVAAWNYGAFAIFLSRWILSFAIAEVVAFLAILFAIMIVFTMIAGFLRKAVSAIGLGIVDRLLGAVFGFVRGCLAGAALMMALAAFAPDSPWVEHSVLAPYFLGTAHAVSFVVPDQFQQQISTGAAHLLQQTPELLRPHTLSQPMP